MAKSNASAGYFHSGLPYNRSGHGPRPLVVFQGLFFENKPLPGLASSLFDTHKFLGEDYTTYTVTRKPGLPVGYTLRDMSDDYATMIREEFGGPVDVIGISTGGSIAHHFAADHPDLVRRLVIHSSAYTLSESARELQMRVGNLARQRQWRAAYTTMFSPMLPRSGLMKTLVGPVIWLAIGILGAPKDPSDLVVTIEAEDKFNFKDRLAEIKAPTLVAAGDKDPFYTETLFRETAEGIPNARLILYKGQSHPAGGEQFHRDVLAFLREGAAENA